ncbi:DUF488 family protein, N3 subclade [Senegalia massiliensis]|uniref:DUF488 family protein, N3 subclade n=1 Tax=Senegalia massiliensis TaxID=1720316 RepID=UPI0013634811|nr:DUF488 family protein [Senegalia massiliensis]
MGKIVEFKKRVKSKGTIYIADNTNYLSVKADLYLLCKPYTDSLPKNSALAKELSPSLELYLLKQAKLSKAIFKTDFKEFKEKYLRELQNRIDSINAINDIKHMLNQNNTICLFDNCKLEEYCHLNILGELFQDKGYKVQYIKSKE